MPIFAVAHQEEGEEDGVNPKELQNGGTLSGRVGEAAPSIPIRQGSKTKEVSDAWTLFLRSLISKMM